MKRNISLTLAGLAAMLLTMQGCQSDPGDNGIVPEKGAITVKMQSGIATRTGVEYSDDGQNTGYMPYWEGADKIGVFTHYDNVAQNSNVAFSIDGAAATVDVAEFTGELAPETHTGDPVKIYAYYPHSVTASGNASKLVVNLPAQQNPGLNSFDPVADIMVARSLEHTFIEGENEATITDVQFRRLMAYTRLHFVVDTDDVEDTELVKSVTLTATGKKLAGDIALSLTKSDIHTDGFTGTASDKVTAGYDDEVTLASFKRTDASSNAVWLVTAPFEVAAGGTISVKIVTDKNNITKAVTLDEALSFTAREAQVLRLTIDDSCEIVPLDQVEEWWTVTTAAPANFQGTVENPYTDSEAYITNSETDATKTLSWTMIQGQGIQSDDTGLIPFGAGYNFRNATGVITSAVIPEGVSKLQFDYFLRVNAGLSFVVKVFKDNTDGEPVWESDTFAVPEAQMNVLQSSGVLNVTGAGSNAIIQFKTLTDKGRHGVGNIRWVNGEGVELPALDTPTGLALSGEADLDSFTVTWNPVAGAAGYRVSINDGTSWSNPVTETSYTASGLTAQTTYQVRVRALGDGATSANSASSAAVPVTTATAPATTTTTFSLVKSLDDLEDGSYLMVGDNAGNTKYYTFGTPNTVNIHSVEITSFASSTPTGGTTISGFTDDTSGTLAARVVTITKVNSPEEGLPEYTIQLPDGKYLYAPDGGTSNDDGSGLLAQETIPDNDAGMWTFGAMGSNANFPYAIIEIKSQSTTASFPFMRFFVGSSYFGCFAYADGTTNIPKRWIFLYKKDVD